MSIKNAMQQYFKLRIELAYEGLDSLLKTPVLEEVNPILYEGELLRFCDKIVAAKNVLQLDDIYLERTKDCETGDSGWYIGFTIVKGMVMVLLIVNDDYVNDPNNLVVCDFNTVAPIEPAIVILLKLNCIIVGEKFSFNFE